jgi:hypothetical protein
MKKVVSLFLLVLFFVSAGAQSFLYFEARPDTIEKTVKTYKLFLSIEADGNATGRILYPSPITNEVKLVELKFIDSAITATSTSDTVLKRYLFPKGIPKFINGNQDSLFLIPRIVFVKKTDSLGSYYEPQKIEFKNSRQQWQTAYLLTNEQKTFDELVKNKEIVKKFYKDGEPFYDYLGALNKRGLDVNDLNTTFYFFAIGGTNDPTVGPLAKKDLAKMTELVTNLTQQLKINFVPIIISGEGFSKVNVERAIDSLKPKAIDIVFFYFSGHGFRYSGDVSKYPRMSFRVSKLQLRAEINLGVEDVYKRLLAKKARVTIVLGDCCNERLGASSPFGLDILRPRNTGTAGLKLNIDNCKKLFFPKQPLSIVIGSASANQLAVGNPDLGSFFTNYFYAELTKVLYSSSGNPSWWNIIKLADESTNYRSKSALCDQTPNEEGRCIQKAEKKVMPLQ